MKKKHYDWVVVGAGFTGAVLAERLANIAGKSVLVIDRRPHIAGNAYDQRNDAGILFHQYGPHIFHTNSDRVANYLSKFTEWLPYEHRVQGLIENRLVPIPFNLTSLAILFPSHTSNRLTDILIENYGLDTRVPILKMLSSQVEEIRELARYIYDKVFLGYTLKQWGLSPEQLSPSVTARVPVYVSFDDRYFQDSFQFMPMNGYTEMFKNILNHNKIAISLNTSLSDIMGVISFDYMIYSGAVDEYFDFSLGELPYRSLSFEFNTYRQTRHQPVGQLNYPDRSCTFTRITEMAHLTQEWGEYTTIAVETPHEHISGKTIPYYPIPQEQNRELHKKYLELAKLEARNVIFCGRLGDYQYYNMDQAIAHSLSIFDKIKSN